MSLFLHTLRFGKMGEETAKKMFRNYDELIEAPPGKWSLWDFGIRWGEKKRYFEVKRDTYTTKTGNFCIEFESNSKPSGISITTAEYYIYLVEGEDKMYCIPTEVIKKMIEDEKYHRIHKGGYKYLSHFYLFNRELFDKYLLLDAVEDVA